MSRYVIAFHSELGGTTQKILESSSEEAVLQFYFEHFCPEYTQDSEGFSCFKDDFHDDDYPMGSIVELS
jgi:hypothetical protein